MGIRPLEMVKAWKWSSLLVESPAELDARINQTPKKARRTPPALVSQQNQALIRSNPAPPLTSVATSVMFCSLCKARFSHLWIRHTRTAPPGWNEVKYVIQGLARRKHSIHFNSNYVLIPWQKGNRLEWGLSRPAFVLHSGGFIQWWPVLTPSADASLEIWAVFSPWAHFPLNSNMEGETVQCHCLTSW